MSRIRGRDTRPELVVRSLLHGMGYRFTVNGPHNKKLPGKPDIVLPKHGTVVFVHGCFWHGHEGCPLFRLPKSRTEWWREKIGRNKERDVRVQETLRGDGWNVLTVWECELATLEKVRSLSRRLPFLVEQKPMQYQLTDDTCMLPMVAEEEGWYEAP